jgi:hypothetical protein
MRIAQKAEQPDILFVDFYLAAGKELIVAFAKQKNVERSNAASVSRKEEPPKVALRHSVIDAAEKTALRRRVMQQFTEARAILAK